jgi:acetyl/propionyl-CoA carboxylase alpha subunit
MESHCYAGLTVTPFYDPLLAKLIVRGETRAEAVSKLQAALHEFEVEGIATNIPFLRRLVATPSYVAGTFDTGFVPKFLDGEAV